MDWFARWFRRRRRKDALPQRCPPPRFAITRDCLTALEHCLADTVEREHEGVAYLLGLTDDAVTLAVAAMTPNAHTTAGSFTVSSAAMARVVRAANDCSLHVVGQVHTHPGDAYHSDGDVTGARIHYPGYVSVVLPAYGRHLPELCGSACYVYTADAGFVAFDVESIIIVPGRMA